MAETTLTNIGDFSAVYGTEAVTFSTNEVSTTIITGLTATKAVDKTHWVDGPLTYTITVTNDTEEQISNILLTDAINPLVTLDTDYGVRIDGATATYTIVGGAINLNLPTMEVNDSHVVTFRVLQA